MRGLRAGGGGGRGEVRTWQPDREVLAGGTRWDSRRCARCGKEAAATVGKAGGGGREAVALLGGCPCGGSSWGLTPGCSGEGRDGWMEGGRWPTCALPRAPTSGPVGARPLVAGAVVGPSRTPTRAAAPPSPLRPLPLFPACAGTAACATATAHCRAYPIRLWWLLVSRADCGRPGGRGCGPARGVAYRGGARAGSAGGAPGRPHPGPPFRAHRVGGLVAGGWVRGGGVRRALRTWRVRFSPFWMRGSSCCGRGGRGARRGGQGVREGVALGSFGRALPRGSAQFFGGGGVAIEKDDLVWDDATARRWRARGGCALAAAPAPGGLPVPFFCRTTRG